jgi:hypothetical protein
VATTDDFMVSTIIIWMCERGFDDVALAEVKRQVHPFETFFLKVDEIVFEYGAPVVSLSCNIQNKILIAMTSTDEFHAFPENYHRDYKVCNILG